MCDDFYLHLSSSEAVGANSANFSINLPTPRTLQGSWKVALKEIHFTQWSKQYVEPEPISFLVLGTAGSGDVFAAWRHEAISNNWADHTPAFQSNLTDPWSYFPNFPYATILTYYRRPPEGGRPATYLMTPGGHYDSIEKYIFDLNAVLYDMERTHLDNLEGGWPMYFTCTDEGKVTCRWNYFKGYWNRLFVFPILGEKSRELLGMGNILDPENTAFRSMIASMVKMEEYVTLPYKHRLTHATDNILVVTNVIEQTGGSKGEDSKVLRIIENPGKVSVPFHLYFNDTNYIKVPLRNFHNIHIRLISASTHNDLTMIGTTTVVLHFVPQNNCNELPTKKSSSIPVARSRSSVRPSALPLVGSEEDVTEKEPPGEPEVTHTDNIAAELPLISPLQTTLDLIGALNKTITGH